MAKDADVKDDPIMDALMDEEQDSPKAEPSPAKEAKAEVKTEAKPQKPEAAKDTKEDKETKAKAEETPTPPDVPTKAKPDEEKPEEEPEGEAEQQPQGKAEERKTQLNTEIRTLVAQKNALQAEVEKINAEIYQPATEEELTEQGMTAIEAKVEAMRQEREMEKYNSQVADAQLTLSSESEQVLRDFPIFNPDSETYDEELANEAAELLVSNLIYDPNSGQVIGSNASVYQLYKTLARASGISAAKGEIKGQQNTEKQLANVDAGSSAAPAKKPEDPILKIWESDE